MSMANGTGSGVTSIDRPYYTTGQRLLRGYGPVAALVLVIVLIAVTVPSKAQKTKNASASGASSGEQVAVGDNGASNAAAGPAAGAAAGGTAGSAGQAGSAGNTVNLPGKTTACAGQALQVPGDPYSPPCILFSGDRKSTRLNSSHMSIS